MMLSRDEAAITYVWCIDDAIREAENAGFTVVRSNPECILLDLDNPRALRIYEDHIGAMPSIFRLVESERWKSKSGNLHVKLNCAPLPFEQRIVIASCLGSDPVRESLAIRMHLDGLKEASVLFKPKVENSSLTNTGSY